ncbi:cytochrome c oxidase assembly factor Coa1 family protein [Vitiosangium sp. GDMCC 1.1324]|uniref:cytochrome c oxidase assembly factor Coa1 family protein n=1 Tax=Vitiosangium sp. (strain GDMCC 1.1324) TaxID=2138576 RepID=UPI000D3398CD|nr:cytochrome c oxidase assembly factor Coa1 family protein [Vitiosangium sp. GDMCC 1.1324]PTL83785.1 hypothetical protein DAT35_09950 [Vitiosangium sp. GDMCC 1.1324]
MELRMRGGSGWGVWARAALLVLCGMGCFAGSVVWTLRRLSSSMEWELRRRDVHRMALHATESSPEATALLGSPMHVGELTLKAHGATPAEGRVDFDLAIDGPRGHGLLEVQAAFARETWTLRKVVLRPEGGAAPVEVPVGR